MNHQHKFRPGVAGETAAVDLLYQHCRRVKGRGWLYHGQHHLDVVSLTVDDIRDSLRPKAGRPILLRSVISNVRVFGLVPGSDDTPRATLTIEHGEPVLSLAVLTGPSELPPGADQ